MFMDPAAAGTPAAAALAKLGYERYELFASGSANVYAYGPRGKVRVDQREVPFTTRIVVVRPVDPRRFSGNVQLVPMHPAAGASGWDQMSGYAAAHGDALVAVMIGADDNTRHAPPGPEPMIMPLRLKAYDPARYAPIKWGDEDGIRWDVFAETAEEARDDPALLHGLKAKRVYASGWSFTGSFLRTFINSGFHAIRSRPGHPLIDGYLIGISSFSYISGYVPINSHSANLAVSDPRRPNVPIDVPVIEMQSENEALTNRDPQSPDRDRGPGAHRLYEIPGLTHGGGIAGRPAARAPQPGSACTLTTTDVNMADYGQAALQNLDRWVTASVPPPRVPRMKAAAGKAIKDEDGNTLGGLRPAQLQVPLARYGAPPEGSACGVARGLGTPVIPMYRNPLRSERLAALYPGGEPEYLRKFDAAVDRLVAARLIRRPDGEREKSEARGWAANAFTASSERR
ncbi:MAG: alpha/beta hydrolase domain-containing protein [Sphingomicrobium sp.]